MADVAFELFVEKGVQQTSIQDIIERANISKGTFYNYFSTKNDCVAEILDGIRYDASQRRIELQVGRPKKDRHVFVEQISSLIQMNEERNINKLIEAILHSNEPELKKMVLHHRIHEFEWFAERLTDVYGSHIRSIAFELSILFAGMLQYILFVLRISNYSQPIEKIVSILLSYIELIMPKMLEQETALLDDSVLDFLRTKIDQKMVSLEEILELAKQIEKQARFTMEQKDLFDTICTELKRDRIRKSVIQPLLKPLKQSIDQHSPLKSQINTFTHLVWYYTKLK